MKKLEIISTVTNCRLSANATKLIRKSIEGFEGKKVLITVERFSGKRSNQQNKYIHVMFSILTEGLNELGNEFSMLEVKEMMKYKFAKCEVINESTGEVIGERIKGTSEMTKLELGSFIDNVVRYALQEFNIVIPLPNESIEIDYEE